MVGIDGSVVRLRAQSLAVFCYLAEHANKVVGKKELLAAIWPDVFVTEDSLAQCVGDIRRAIADSNRTVLRTVSRQGYMLVGSPAQSTHPMERAAEPELVSGKIQAERRQLTVMFCDLVGSTDLTREFDPEDLHEVLKDYQQAATKVIQAFGGHVAQYRGDGLVVYFGWPRAHEDSAEGAIRAALGIIEAVSNVPAPKPLQVRIGIATGAVVVGERVEGEASVPKLAVGETPNLAARVQGLAQADQIIISSDSRRLVGGTFELADLGEQVLRGIAEPVRAWHVTGLATTEGRFDASRPAGGLTPVIGRGEELEMLLSRWELAQGNEGQVVLLSGESGIGKSRLINALRENLHIDNASAMRFQCLPYYANSALWPTIQSLGRALNVAQHESVETKLDKLESLIVGHFKQPLTDVRFIASLLSIPSATSDERYGALAMIPQKFKDETLRTLVDMTEAAAKQQPTVLMFEDAHWADPASLELLTLMIDRVKSMPLLMLITHRPEFENRWADHGHVTALNLNKLTRAQSSALVLQVTQGKTLPQDLLEQILAKTDGVPLFVEELTHSILESGELIDRGDTYDYAGTAHRVTIPATLRDSLMARLDRYQSVRELAQIGAVVGREFSYELIAAVAPIQTTALDQALSQFTESGLAFRRGTPPDAVYTFKHALVQDAAYDSLLKSRRRVLHGEIAQTLGKRLPETPGSEPEILAHHLTEAGEVAAAIPLWQQAGGQARRRMAMSEAIAHLNKGLSLLQSLPASDQRDASELAFRGQLGRAYSMLRGWGAPEVRDNLQSAHSLARKLKRSDLLAAIQSGLFANVLNQGRIAEALTIAREMLNRAESSGSTALRMWGHAHIGQSCVKMGRLTEALEHIDALSALYDPHKHRRGAHLAEHDEMITTNTFKVHAIWALGYADKAVRLLEETIISARERGNPLELGLALIFGSWVPYERGEPELLRRYAKEGEQLGRENNLPVLSAMMAPAVYSMTCIAEGKASEAIVLIEDVLAARNVDAFTVEFPRFYALLAQCKAHLGDVDGALQLIDASIELVERPGNEARFFYAEFLRLKGWMLTLKDDLAGAEKNYQASLDCARQQQAKAWELLTATSLARLWQQQGRQGEAVALLEPIYDWFTEGFDTADLKDARALLDTLK